MPEVPTAIRTVAIVEPGLIGASFGLALRKAGFTGSITGVGEEPYIRAAVAIGAIDRIGTLVDAAAQSDLILLSGTVSHILQTLEHLSPLVRTGSLITDVGSTKRKIVETARQYLPHESFIGGHPLAGKEKRGAEHAEANLFEQRPYVVTSRPNTPVCEAFFTWLHRMQVIVVDMDADQHDATVAFSSHLPQLLSTTLALTLSRRSELPVAAIHGSGLTDMTRLALSSSNLWDSILETNEDYIVSAIDNYITTLKLVRDSLNSRDVDDIFEKAREYAYLYRARP